jgi:hypothetical protein
LIVDPSVLYRSLALTGKNSVKYGESFMNNIPKQRGVRRFDES